MESRLTLPPLEQIRNKCREILNRELKPIQYKTLVRSAWSELGFTEFDKKAFFKRAEDLRENTFERFAFGFGYIGQPHCLVVLKSWFERNTLFNTLEPLHIPLSCTALVNGINEAARRMPHILNKFQDGFTNQFNRVSLGLTLESHVSEYFKKNWAQFWLPPDNNGQFTQPCRHDFKLQIPSAGVLEVDVARSGRDDLFGVARGGKSSVHIHLIADFDMQSNTVSLFGFKYGSDFKGNRFTQYQTEPIQRLLVYLNCQGGSIPFNQIRTIFEFEGCA